MSLFNTTTPYKSSRARKELKELTTIQLIEVLQKCPPNAKVVFTLSDNYKNCGCISNVEEVDAICESSLCGIYNTDISEIDDPRLIEKIVKLS